MRIKDILNVGNIQKCSPIYGILILAFICYFVSLLHLKIMDKVELDYIKYLLTMTLFFVTYISVILVLCHKNYRKTAYILSYSPISILLFVSMYFFYGGLDEYKQEIDEIKRNNSNTPAQS